MFTNSIKGIIWYGNTITSEFTTHKLRLEYSLDKYAE